MGNAVDQAEQIARELKAIKYGNDEAWRRIGALESDLAHAERELELCKKRCEALKDLSSYMIDAMRECFDAMNKSYK